MDATTEQRFWAKVSLDGDCWEWQGALWGGYGMFKVARGRTGLAHRIAYELTVGPIPAGLHLDHLCRNRRCVRPDHLEPVTRRENILRGVGVAAMRARQTECSRGHTLSGANVYRKPNGTRECRACRAEHRKGYEAAHPGRRRVAA